MTDNRTNNSSGASVVPSAASQSRDWIVGVIDAPADAEQAERELHAAGFAAEEVVLMHGPDAVQAHAAQQEHQGLLRRIMSGLMGEMNDSGGFERDYDDEAKMGHSVISVYAPQAEDITQAQQIMEAHGGHRIKHYGQWTVNQLSMQERDQHEPQAAAGLQAAADANQQSQAGMATDQPVQVNTPADQQTQRGMAADQQMGLSSPSAATTSVMPNTTGAQTGMAEPSNTQAHMTSQPNTTNTTNAQTNLPNTVESASGWQTTPIPTDAETTDDNQYPGEGI